MELGDIHRLFQVSQNCVERAEKIPAMKTAVPPRRGMNMSAQGKRSAALGLEIRKREALKGRNSRECLE
jgi:hypothetical protein